MPTAIGFVILAVIVAVLASLMVRYRRAAEAEKKCADGFKDSIDQLLEDVLQAAFLNLERIAEDASFKCYIVPKRVHEKPHKISERHVLVETKDDGKPVLDLGVIWRIESGEMTIWIRKTSNQGLDFGNKWALYRYREALQEAIEHIQKFLVPVATS